MAAAMYQALSRLCSDYCQKALFISVSSDFYENNIVTRNFCVSTHHSYCSLEIYKFHILLIGSSFDWVIFISHKKLLIFKYRFFSNVISSTGDILNQLDRAVNLDLKWKGAEKKPRVAKERLLRKKFNCRYLCSNQKLASTQTIGSVFLERVRKVQNSKSEHDLLKITD